MKKSIALIMAVLVLATTLLSNAVFAANDPAFVVSNATGKPGDTVQITVSTANNPGIVSAKVKIGYDASVLELVSAGQGADFTGTQFGPITKNPFTVNWEDFVSPENITTNGSFATLTFKILDTAAAGRSDITLTYNPADVLDFDFAEVYFTTVAGSVTVESNAPSIDYETEFPEAAYNNGANIRFAAEDVLAGLRFAATIDKATLGIEGKYKYEEDGDMTFGMLLLPKYLLQASGYTKLSDYFLSGNATSILDIPAKKVWAQDDDLITYTAVVTGVPENKWEVEVEAVPYMLKDGDYYFAETDKMTKSYYGVAKEAREGDYTDSKISAITDPAEKAAAQKIASELQKIIDAIDKKDEDPDGPGWIDGWY